MTKYHFTIKRLCSGFYNINFHQQSIGKSYINKIKDSIIPIVMCADEREIN